MRRHAAAAVALGVGSVIAAAGMTAATAGPGVGIVGRIVAALVGFLAVLAALVTVHSSDDGGRSLVATAPERPRRDRPLAGRSFAAAVDEAATAAREAGSVEAGVEAARPALRATLVAVLTRAGEDPDAARTAVDRGTWTDDPVAAAALSSDVRGRPRPLRRRLLDWLRPGRVARRRVGRATAAVAAVADERLPSVPGRGAPRTAPVTRPSLADLRRAADGTLETAVDPGAVGGTSGRTRDGESVAGTDSDRNGGRRE